MKELKRIIRKLKIDVPSSCPDYSLHGFFVKAAAGEGEHKQIARQLHKLLERKFQSIINKTRNIKDNDDLVVYWQSSLEAGTIPGPYWAVITSPYISSEFQDVVYGEIHMLSHLEGAANRNALAQLQTQEKRFAQMEEGLAKERAKHRRQLSERDARIQELEVCTRSLSKTSCALEEARDRLKLMVEQSRIDIQQQMIANLQTRLAESEEQAAAKEIQYKEVVEKSACLENANEELQRRVEALVRDSRAMEQALMAMQNSVCDNGDCPVAGTGEINLCGRCIVFVGGRSTQAPHFRALVEQYNGRFVHHDGGLGDGQARLEGALSKADAVIFPVDCVSHNATRDIKRYCKQTMKPFVPLPTSGLASFTRGLHDTVEMLAAEGSEVGMDYTDNNEG
ncbi:MAG: DUF2325 domain-containing protein [Rhodospirillales bacterium]|nr:DUF2325 domain-containing protein [Rhodospirillales bacterium]